jgi:hypothetical protein
MPAAQIPLWVTIAASIAGSFGVGTVVGNLVSFWLQRKTWVKDNKKQEWRELIDALSEALRVMMEHRHESYTDILTPAENVTPAEDVRYREEAIRKGYVAIGDRIFIVKKVRDSGLFERWVALSNDYEKVDASIPEGLNRFNSFVKHSHKFQDDLIQFSREDLGLD